MKFRIVPTNEFIEQAKELDQKTKSVVDEKIDTSPPVFQPIEETDKLLQPSSTKYVSQMNVRELIAEEEYSGNEAYTLLTKLEKLSIKEYYRIFGDIKETVMELEKKQKDLKASGD